MDYVGWLYKELLDLLKQKEEKDAEYEQIELELPLEQPPETIKQPNEQDEEKDRGVTIIDLTS